MTARPWAGIARCFPLGMALILCLPVCAIIYSAFFPSEPLFGTSGFEFVLGRYLKNTVFLLAGVSLFTVFFGVGTAFLVSVCDFPLRTLLRVALLLPMSFPAYILAFVYTDFFEYSGAFQIALRDVFGFSSPGDYYFPEIRSLGGAIFVMGLSLYPYVYLVTAVAFLEQSANLSSAAACLGMRPVPIFFSVMVPLAKPAIMAGLALVLMETLNDIGTVEFFAVQNITHAIYTTWLVMGNLGGAAQLALVSFFFIGVLIYIEKISRKKQTFFHASGGEKGDRMTYTLKGYQAVFAVLFCAFPLVMGFAVPFGILGYYCLSYFAQSYTDAFLLHTTRSVLLAAATGLLVVFTGFWTAFSLRVEKHRLARRLVSFATLGYAMPGTVIAIGCVLVAGMLDRLTVFLTGSDSLLLSGTLLALIYGYSVRFVTLSHNYSVAGFARISPELDSCAALFGRSGPQTALEVHLPLLKKNLLAAFVLVFVDTMKELPVSLMLRPFNFETLATFVYQFATDERLEESALGALTIVLVGLIPVSMLTYKINSAGNTT